MESHVQDLFSADVYVEKGQLSLEEAPPVSRTPPPSALASSTSWNSVNFKSTLFQTVHYFFVMRDMIMYLCGYATPLRQSRYLIEVFGILFRHTVHKWKYKHMCMLFTTSVTSCIKMMHYKEITPANTIWFDAWVRKYMCWNWTPAS